MPKPIRPNFWDRPPDEPSPDTPSPILPLTYLSDIKPKLDANDFVQGLLISASSVVVYGESNAGKTFWTTDLALYVASGMTWNGRRVEQGGVIYCVLEGSGGFHNRVSAWRAAYECKYSTCHFAAIEVALNLLDPNGDVGSLIATIKAAGEKLGVPVVMVVIDTLSRALAGGNENAPEDMGAMVRNMDRIRAETRACFVFIHHSGKDQARGMRGHSLLRAAIDTEIEVLCDESTGQRQAHVLKQRELKKGDIFGFRLEVEELGKNRFGEAVTTMLVVHDYEPHPVSIKGDRKLPDAAAIGMRALKIAISKAGALLPPLPEYPANTVAVHERLWRDELYQLKGGEEANRRQTFNRAEKYLLANELITKRNGFVWAVKRATEPTQRIQPSDSDLP